MVMLLEKENRNLELTSLAPEEPPEAIDEKLNAQCAKRTSHRKESA